MFKLLNFVNLYYEAILYKIKVREIKLGYNKYCVCVVVVKRNLCCCGERFGDLVSFFLFLVCLMKIDDEVSDDDDDEVSDDDEDEVVVFYLRD
jgi:hypothetical protein